MTENPGNLISRIAEKRLTRKEALRMGAQAGLLGLLAPVIGGCAASPAPTSSAGQSEVKLAGGPKQTYAMVTFIAGHPFWVDNRIGMEKAAELLNMITGLQIETTYQGGAEYDLTQVSTVLEQVIAKKPQGIVLTCINPEGMIPPINKAMDAGIPVVTFDSDAPASKRLIFSAMDNYRAGRTGGKALAELVGGKGKYFTMGLPGQLNVSERSRGAVDYIKENHPDMEFVDYLMDKSDHTEGAKQTSAILQAHPDIIGGIGFDASSGVGMANGVREAGKKGQVKIVCVDKDKGTMDLIASDEIQATLVQASFNMGFWSMMFAFAAANKLTGPAGPHASMPKDMNPLPSNLDTGVTVVTKASMDYFIQTETH